MAQSRLKRGFDPIWSSEFLDFKLLRLSKPDFILRQMYRLYRYQTYRRENLLLITLLEIQ